MTQKFHLNLKLQTYFAVPLLLMVFILFMDLIAVFMVRQVVEFMLIFTVIYGVAAVAILIKCRQLATAEIRDSAVRYAYSQRLLMGEFRSPYALLDPLGRILWSNAAFQKLAAERLTAKNSITSVFSMITRDYLEKMEAVRNQECEMNGRYYNLQLTRIDTSSQEDSQATAAEFPSVMYALYVTDHTELKECQQKVDGERMISALLYIDNYEEALDDYDDMKKSLITALIDKRINQYFGRFDGLVRRTEKDKYFVLFKKAYLNKMIDEKFHILEEIRSIKKDGKGLAITISMGIGVGDGSYRDGYMMSRNAIDLALGRGGDQVVVKDGERIEYYGGKAKATTSKNRVKARVKAQALQEIIESTENILIMGHSLTDEDALGAGIGVYCAARSLGRAAQIVINNPTSSIRPLMETFTIEKGYPSDLFINSAQALEMASPKTLIMVVDTNRPSYTECPELLKESNRIVVFDHHRQGSEVIENPVLSYIEPYASSACEMVAEVLQYFNGGIKLSDTEADCIYAGILIDTNNFMTKTGVRTFEAAAFLKRSGAEVTRVRKMLRNDMACYKARAEAVHKAEVYRGVFAISVCPGDNVESPTIVGAQAADELLNIIGIKASFVMTEYNGKIFVSARSIDEINVQVIMEKLGGGGHLNTAGAQLKNCTVEEARIIIQNTLDEMIEKGDIVL